MIRSALLALAVPVAAAAQQIDSVYTTYDRNADCRTLQDDLPADEAAMGFRMVCPRPDGFYLMLAEGDARISMDYATTQRFGPWESFTSFNTVHDTVEWRRQRLDNKTQPFATIHRWDVGPSHDDREILVISTVATAPDAESCMVGVIDTTNTPDANTLARAVADRYAPGFVCGNARPRAFGYVGLETPLPRRVTPHQDTPKGEQP